MLQGKIKNHSEDRKWVTQIGQSYSCFLRIDNFGHYTALEAHRSVFSPCRVYSGPHSKDSSSVIMLSVCCPASSAGCNRYSFEHI